MSDGLIPSALPAAPVASTPSTAGSTSAPAQTVPGDFVAMLSQLIGQEAELPATSLPLMPAALQLSAVARQDTDDMQADECAGLAALLAFLPPSQFIADGGSGVIRADGASLVTVAGASLKAQQDLLISVGAEALADEFDAVDPGGGAGDIDVLPFAQSAQEAPATLRSTNAAEAVLARPVHAPVGSAAWSDEIGARLTMMTEHGKHSASLRLSPEHLGPLEVRIAVNDDRATVWFGAAHADTRAAIEQALPRLRELFEAQGMSLTDAGVFHEPPREQPKPQMTSQPQGDASVGDDAVVTSAKVRLGLVDAYA